MQLIPGHWYRVKVKYLTRGVGLAWGVGALILYERDLSTERETEIQVRTHRFAYQIPNGLRTISYLTAGEVERHLEYVGATVAQPLFGKPEPLFSVSRTAWQWLDADDGIGDDP